MNVGKATVNSASICCALGVVGVGVGVSGPRTPECMQYGRKDEYDTTSDMTAYNCRRMYLVIERGLGGGKRSLY